jgi:hypothetical protein
MDQAKPENKLKPLTDDEIRQVFHSKDTWFEKETIFFNFFLFARAIEEKHGIK